MNAVDGSQHYEQASTEQNPSLLTVILDVNPAAWSLLADTLSFSKAVGNLIIFLNAHLACNYTNKVAVIASHSGCSQWLYPSPVPQHRPKTRPAKRKPEDTTAPSTDNATSDSPKRLKLNGPQDDSRGIKLKLKLKANQATAQPENDKYRPFRIIEEEILRNLTQMLSTMDPSTVSTTSSTQVAGALTLALSYINRQTLAVAVTAGRAPNPMDAATSNMTTTAADSSNKTILHSRILFVSVSPSHDLAHQYIPIMNAIFACQRLSIPIDICQIPIPKSRPSPAVFLQQACDATRGIYIPLSDATTSGFLQYLMMAFLPTQSSRLHLVSPTRIDVDFRAACFCHRKVVDTGFVCSICLSIFCSVPENGECLTCGTQLELGDYGARPVVVPRKKKKRNRLLADGSRVSTPGPGP